MPEDDSLFVGFFGGTPVVRIMDFLLENPLFDYTKKEIAEGANISQSTLEKVWGQIEESGAVTKTRRIDKAQLYATNRESLIIQELSRIGLTIADRYAEKACQEQQVAA